MRKFIEYQIDNIEEFKIKLTQFADKFNFSCILNSNSFEHNIEFVAAIGIYDELKFKKKQCPFNELYEFYKNEPDWIFGHFNYDIKNILFNDIGLKSNNPDFIGFDDMCFVKPKFVILVNDYKVKIFFTKNDNSASVNVLYYNIINTKIKSQKLPLVEVKNRITKKNYLNIVNKIKRHIQNGDIYEMNFCQEFYSENVNVNPVTLYNKLCEISPAPFSCFYKNNKKYLCCASPERFISKTGNKIISQPIKGTSKKSNNKLQNIKLIKNLQSDAKERAENIMIVDLVRNDLSVTAEKQSVKVDELCGIYEFPQVYQMISTISSQLSDKYNFTDAIKYAFPMGSMTGAPKIKAMELIEKYETTKRGLFSGTVGYITPEADFDFNVIIRSFQYNKKSQYLNFITGGAITINSIDEKEYEECLIKAKGLYKTLSKIKYNKGKSKNTEIVMLNSFQHLITT